MSDDEVVEAVRRVEEPRSAPGDSPAEPSGLTGPVRTLDPRVRILWALGTTTAALVLGAIVGVTWTVVLQRSAWPGPVVFVVVAGLGLGHAVLRYRAWHYEVREDSLFLNRGVVTLVRTVVPYVRIQHVDVSRGPVERALGLSSVVVYTAGSRGADVTIPGLPPARADDLQARLKRLAIVAEGEDAV